MSEIQLRRPAEGWLPLALLVLMALTLGWAMDDPGWVNGKEALTDSLPGLALLGLAAGFIGPKLGWGRWTTHLVGALFAGLTIPIFAGLALHPGVSPAEAFRWTAGGTVDAYLDLAWRGRQFTSEEIHYILVLGGVIWGTTQFAAYAVFGHRRPLSAVVVVGLVLVANMGVTSQNQLHHLVVFTAASLFLLIAMHAFDERTTWARRRIGDPGAIAGVYLRGGTVFIMVALIASLGLTDRAASSPLAGAWESVDTQLTDFAETIGRIFPVGGDRRGGGGPTFGRAAQISAEWFSNDDVALVATIPAKEQGFKWRAATYDTFRLTGWEQTAITSVAVPAGSPLLEGTPEDPSVDLTRRIDVEVKPDGFRDHNLLSPGTPVSVSQDSAVLLGGEDGWLAGIDLPGASSGYTVTARVLLLGDTGLITRNRLRAASTGYPDDIRARYTDVPAGAMGPDASKLLATIRRTVARDNPYDLANAIEAYLRSDANFTYQASVRNVPCDSRSAVECFARTRKGYCLHYASTMAILLRAANPDNPIPTRLVQGFLPGTVAGTTETIRNRDAHAWVEVYFPGYGWIPFDPTGGGVGRPAAIPEGPPVASSSPAPRASRDDEPLPSRGLPRASGSSGTPGGANQGRPGDRTLLIILTVLLALMVAGVALAVWLRGPRGEISPDRAWLTLSRGAARLGFAPRPTQTIYEYAATLGDLVPIARPDLKTVADAKVETAYARASLAGDRLQAVRAATRRLRVSLLRLVLRRGRRRRR